jgi:uncharacterized repeat protein (TIGR03803 family)
VRAISAESRSNATDAKLKIHTGRLIALLLHVALFALMLERRVAAQTFKTIHNFTAGSGTYPNVSNMDGTFPVGSLIVSQNTLYGTASSGGASGEGTVFKVDTDGTGFTNLHSFTIPDSNGRNLDGVNPQSGLVLSGNTLYGTAPFGGSSGNGTVFAVNTDGTGFTNVYSFTSTPRQPFASNSDGANPYAALVLSGDTLYGTASQGGTFGNGTAFAINTDGTGFTNLHNFSGWPSDGASPQAGLILSGNTLYGTASSGGFYYNGSVFGVNTDGTGFTNLYSFAPNDGFGGPRARLVQSGNILYGTTTSGGWSGAGAVFAVNIDGTGFTNLHNFTGYSFVPPFTNSDGTGPRCGLILSGITLYGTALFGGSSGNGTVFAVNTDGTGFTNVYSFTATSPLNATNSDGANPYAGLVLSGHTMFGTAEAGGSWENGTVFSISLPVSPQLTITPSAGNVILTWPTVTTGYTLQSTTNLVSSVWTTNSSAPIVVNGQNTVTNSISGTQQFFRLSQ